MFFIKSLNPTTSLQEIQSREEPAQLHDVPFYKTQAERNTIKHTVQFLKHCKQNIKGIEGKSRD